MSNNVLTNAQALQLGIEWFKTESHSISQLYLAALQTIAANRHGYIPEELLQQASQYAVEDIIRRMEGELLSVEQLKNSFIERAKNSDGAEFQSMIEGVDALLRIIIDKTQQELADQPQVRTAILEKVKRVVQTVRIAIAAAIIEYRTD